MRISDWSSDVCSSDLQWLLFLTLWVVLRGHILSMLPRTDCSQGEKPSPELAWFAYLVGILRGFVHLLADDLGGDLVEMGGEGTAQFLKLWPKRHLDEAGRGTDNDGLTVHPRVAEGLDAVSTA